MPAHSRSKNGVASLAYVAGIRVVPALREQGVDGRDKPGHDERISRNGAVEQLDRDALRRT